MSGAGNPQVVGPGMRKLLVVVLVVFAVLVVDSVYLGAITFLQWLNDVNLEDEVYQSAFLVHLALGFAIVVPAIVYAILHLRRAYDQPNRLAVRLGLVLFATVLVLLASGIALTRGVPLGELRHPVAREVAYWLHIATPVVAGWLFVLHRLAGRPVRWSVGGRIAVITLVVSFAGWWLAEPRDSGPTGEPEFLPEIPPEEMCWKLHFLIGTMVQVMSDPQRLHMLSEGRCDPYDVDAVLRRLVPFLLCLTPGSFVFVL